MDLGCVEVWVGGMMLYAEMKWIKCARSTRPVVSQMMTLAIDDESEYAG